MSRAETKSDLLFYLADDKVPVIALKGRWGTGKTHLWLEVAPQLSPDLKPLYASCFGVDNIDQLRARLFHSMFGKGKEVAGYVDKNRSGLADVTDKVMKMFNSDAGGIAGVIGGAAGLIQSTVVDQVLQDRLIVLDDVERRGEALKADSVLGFIDSLKGKGCKVLLIFNEEPLQEKQAKEWHTLKEKSIDRELSLLTTPDEAAAHGLSTGTPGCEYATAALRDMNVTNIRVVQRVDRILAMLLGKYDQVDTRVIEFWARAVVFYTSLNFGAVLKAPELPTLNKEWIDFCVRGVAARETTESVGFAGRFQLTREIELLDLLFQHLTTGKRFETEFQELLRVHGERQKAGAAVNEAERFVEDLYQDPTKEKVHFLATAQKHADLWCDVSPRTISTILGYLRQHDNQLAEKILAAWRERWTAVGKLWDSHLYSLDDLDAGVAQALRERNEVLRPRPSILEAVVRVSSGGWNPADEAAINGATSQDMESAILSLDKSNFGQFVHFFKEQHTSPLTRNSAPIFAPGVEAFMTAANNIRSKQGRWAELLSFYLT